MMSAVTSHLEGPGFNYPAWDAVGAGGVRQANGDFVLFDCILDSLIVLSHMVFFTAQNSKHLFFFFHVNQNQPQSFRDF